MPSAGDYAVDAGQVGHGDGEVTEKRFRIRVRIEPVIGCLKKEYRLKRNFLMGFEGDQSNLMMAAAGMSSLR